jgi:hypothetical protein
MSKADMKPVGGQRLAFWCDWPEWFVGKWNWRNFTFIVFEIETSNLLYEHELEIRVGLIGFNVRIDLRWGNSTAELNSMIATRDQIQAELEDPNVEVIESLRCIHCHQALRRTSDGLKCGCSDEETSDETQ